MRPTGRPMVWGRDRDVAALFHSVVPGAAR